jgi:E3 ubiquitin-protein ligase DOA10
VVTLPCDKRHYFHDECIKNWLERNNACPLCKKPITEADLKKQKREMQRDAARN